MSDESNPTRALSNYVTAGASLTVATDLFMVRDEGLDPSTWAALRGCTTEAVTRSISRAHSEYGLIGQVEADRLKGLDNGPQAELVTDGGE